MFKYNTSFIGTTFFSIAIVVAPNSHANGPINKKAAYQSLSLSGDGRIGGISLRRS
jgi:hypothetical protein